MHRIALGIEYEGTHFSGWQRQVDLPTVQGSLEQALAQIVGEPVAVLCAGRTDAGVHACNQVVHFTSPVPRVLDAWVKGTNSHLPKEIRVRWAKPVDDTFHARFSATARRYLYLIHQDPISPAVARRGVTWVPYSLDVAKMAEAAKGFLGEQDFSSFRDSKCQAKTPIRTVDQFHVHQMGSFVLCDIKANAFLHHMVRNMVGLLLAIGRGCNEVHSVKTILALRSRPAAPPTASPDGLYLYQVDYPEYFELPKQTGLSWPLQFLDKYVL